MFEPFEKEIDRIAVLFAHVGGEPDGGNRVYAVAGRVLGMNGKADHFYSTLHYNKVTVREYHRSGLSAEELADAPSPETVRRKLADFLDNAPIVLMLNERDAIGAVRDWLPEHRIVDLNFAAEFFLPGLLASRLKYLHEFLRDEKRERIAFSAEEALDLSVELVRYITNGPLDGDKNAYAPVLRYFLKKSETLFGALFRHLNENFQSYFGGLFAPSGRGESGTWKRFLEHAPKLEKEERPNGAREPVPPESVGPLFDGLAAGHRGFAPRPEQIAYARHVVHALNDRAVLAVEAGTGTGKTQGYLIPCFEFLRRNPKQRVVISTYTKSLQEQIFQREIGLTQAAIPYFQGIPVALLKGKSSYICAEKLDGLYDDGLTGPALLAWLYCLILVFRYQEADLDTVGESVRAHLNGDLALTRMLRMASAGSGCPPRHKRCPAQIVTGKALAARLVVTNHHKLALMDYDPLLGGVFTNFVIDEANHFEAAVRSAYGTEFHSREIKQHIDYLSETTYRHRKALRKVLSDKQRADLKNAIAEFRGLETRTTEFRNVLRSLNPRALEGVQALPFDHPAFREERIQPHLRAMRGGLVTIIDAIKFLRDSEVRTRLHLDPRTGRRVESTLDELGAAADALKVIADNLVSANNITAYQLFRKHWMIAAQWVEVSDLIRHRIYEQKDAVIYTAATLCHRNRFDSFRVIAGMYPLRSIENEILPKPFRFARLPSPFAADVMELIVPEDAVSGKYENKAAWLAYVGDRVPRLIAENRGRTLVLFSSYQDMQEVAEQVGRSLDGERYPLLIQRPGQPTLTLCDEFRAVKESVLFGVDTFWYGVDFPGDTLTQVIITRIPYPPPSDPLLMARRKIMTPDLYWDRYRYDTEIKMRQGIGRLIRRHTDRGRVVILDARYRRNLYSFRP